MFEQPIHSAPGPDAGVAAPSPSVALIAGGGAIKAYAYHVGVLFALRDHGFHFRAGTRWEPVIAPPASREIDTYVGSSAGACVVAGVIAGQDLEEMRGAVMGEARTVPRFGYRVMFAPVAPNPTRYAQRLWRRWQMGHLKPHHLFDLGGVVSAAGMERYFRRHVLPTNRFGDLAPRVFLVATQVNGSRKVVFGPADSIGRDGYGSECAYYDNIEISEAIAAAVSLPPLFAPYGIVNPSTGKTFHYFDGEVREPLSLHVARDVRADFAIVSSIWRPYAYEDSVGSLAQFGMITLAEQALHQSIEQKVARDRTHTDQVEHAMELIARHGREHGLASEATAKLQREIAETLGHRRVRSLYVAPAADDADFFFRGYFRFTPSVIERCIEAGYRAFESATKTDPGFLEELDGKLGTRN